MVENPLKQYFRRPAVYIKLPSQGLNYEPGVVTIPPNGDIPIYPMTAIDEITSRTPDAVFNGQAVAEIVKSCVPCIHDPWKINIIDLDTLLVAIKIASNGDSMDINSTCPACKTENKFACNLVGLLNQPTTHNYNKTLTLRDLEISFRPLTYEESNKNSMVQYELEKAYAIIQTWENADDIATETKKIMARLNDAMIDTIAHTVNYIRTPDTTVNDKSFIKEFLLNCDKITHNKIIEHSLELRNSSKFKPFSLKCMNCNHEYQQDLVINITDFFG